MHTERPAEANAHDLLDPSGEDRIPDLGDLIVVLLASTLAGLRDRLSADGFEAAADLVADLVEIIDDYVTRMATAP